MAGTKDHLIGLLLGAEEDWPQAFEQILRFVGPLDVDGTEHRLASERLTIEPFDLTDPVRTGLVIDRLAHWYFHPREWLKKAALVNGTYLLNSPFTFQSMEKHSAYCAMIRLGLKVPPTILVPYKNPLDNHRWAYTAATYNKPFDLDVLAAELGYPLYMKPFDGGGWRGVSAGSTTPTTCTRPYDDSGEMLMHLQATVEYDHFARALSIGPETMVMDFRPEQPMHNRYAVTHDFLSAVGRQAGRRRLADRQRLLPLGVQLRGDAGRGRRGLPDRLRQRLPGRRGHLAALLLPLGDHRPGEVVDVLPGHRAAARTSTSTIDAVLRDRRLRPHLRREARRLPRAGRRALRDRALPRLVRRAPRPSRRRSSPSGSAAPTSTGCSSRRCRRPTRPRSTSEFLAHFRGLIGLWVEPTQARSTSTISASPTLPQRSVPATAARR